MTVLPDTPIALIVDDDPDVRTMVADLLETLGLRGVPVADANTVVEVAVAQRPALIVLDVIMPDPDGYTVAVRLRGDSRTASIPIVFMTGQEASIYRTLSFGLGAVAFLEKPFNSNTLRAAVGQALGR